MKITKVKATPVNIPLETPFWWTGGQYPGTSKTIIEMETDEGLTGLGEAPSANVISVAEGPGLGVALDREAFDHWHRHYVDNGPMNHFYDPDKPGGFRRLPLA
jgi:L-alanine-DL-glutamate epimerase-like enolase superfamily enzyme